MHMTNERLSKIASGHARVDNETEKRLVEDARTRMLETETEVIQALAGTTENVPLRTTKVALGITLKTSISRRTRLGIRTSGETMQTAGMDLTIEGLLSTQLATPPTTLAN